jgi:hypothetical protein
MFSVLWSAVYRTKESYILPRSRSVHLVGLFGPRLVVGPPIGLIPNTVIVLQQAPADNPRVKARQRINKRLTDRWIVVERPNIQLS